MAADKSVAAQNPLPDANFSHSRARLGNISRAQQLFPPLEVSRLLDRAGTNFRAILRVLRSITRRRVITRTITRDERLNGRLMGNRRADPRVARNID